MQDMNYPTVPLLELWWKMHNDDINHILSQRMVTLNDLDLG